jgi:hypothetical protein
MRRRTIVTVIALSAFTASATLSTHSVSASIPQAVAPQQIDPLSLKLPASSLPPGQIIVDHQSVSDNPDADGITTPPDKFKSQLAILHQTPYETLGRITGYRFDFRYNIGSAQAGTEYLASIFPDQAHAQAAMNDAIGPGSLIQIIGHPLTHQCSVGVACAAYSGPVPGSTPLMDAVVAIYYDGPILVETATQVPDSLFTSLEPQIETILFGFLAAADIQVQAALSGTPPGTPVLATATATATVTATPRPTPTKAPLKKCKKGYKRVHGKCKRKKH